MGVVVMKSAIQSVFQNPKYVVMSILISTFTFFIFILVNNFSTFVTVLGLNASPRLLVDVTTNGAVNILDASGSAMFASIITVSILSGITIPMIIYQMRITRSFGKKNLASFGGIFGGAFSSTCSACSTTVASILGATGGLAILPLKGLEFSLPSIGILVASMYFISKSLMESGRCKI